MRNKTLLALVALLGLALGYFWTTGWSTNAVARSSTMPANPHIVYLSPVDAVHGLLTPQVVEERGGSTWQTWEEVKDAAEMKPLDAILVEQTKFADLTETDLGWLREQIEDGVIVVGIGIDIEPFSASLGLPSLRAEGEAPIPIGDDGYYLFEALLLGAPEDVEAMREAYWLEQSILDEHVQIDTQNPLHSEWGTSRGKLATEQDVDGFFADLMKWIEGVYDSRSTFEQSLAKS